MWSSTASLLDRLSFHTNAIDLRVLFVTLVMWFNVRQYLLVYKVVVVFFFLFFFFSKYLVSLSSTAIKLQKEE